MTWRRFSTLLRGLSPQSASASRAQVRRATERSGEKVVEITDRKRAQSAFVSLFGKRGTKHQDQAKIEP